MIYDCCNNLQYGNTYMYVDNLVVLFLFNIYYDMFVLRVCVCVFFQSPRTAATYARLQVL